MSPATVLSTAHALREFTAPQVAAYGEDDEAAVRAVLLDHPDLFERVPSSGPDRWRVTDLDRLQRVIAAAKPLRTPAPRASTPRSGPARLLMAERTLVRCGDERSAAGRKTMAATALNYLRQFVAELIPEPASWWRVERGVVESLTDRATIGSAPVTRSRLRTAFALARLTACEADAERVGIGFLIETAQDIALLAAAPDLDTGIPDLAQRFADLARALTTPAAPDDPGRVAPARLLSALAWRRAAPEVRGSLRKAADAQVTLLRGLADNNPLEPSEGSAHLYRLLDRTRHGRCRIAVYGDLLPLLPSRFDCEVESALLPGALVEATTDVCAATLLQRYADTLERDLAGSPFASERALIGQVVHRFDDFTDAAQPDASVVDRSTRTRRELLALVGIHV
jgi:hypothetical protein